MKAIEEFERLYSEAIHVTQAFNKVILIDPSFLEYITKLQSELNAILEEWYPYSQRSKKKRETWDWYKNLCEQYFEKATAAWTAYSKMDLNRAFLYQYKFDGNVTKKTPFLPPKNCKQYCIELKEAIDFTVAGDPHRASDVEVVRKYMEYHHPAYIYLLTVDAEAKIGHKISQGTWKDLRRLSAEFEQLGNIFINQGKK